MRVIISTDLEGISGVILWDQTGDKTSSTYQDARRLLMGDINAAVDGCLDGGATEVVVSDGHGGGFNVVPELMHPKAKTITGIGRPPVSKRAEAIGGFDAQLLVGYHAMAGTEDGILRHTQSHLAGNRYWYNGRECGEIAQSSLLMGHFGTPTVMVTGDEAACREARDLLGDEIVTVAVKQGFGEQYGMLVAPAAAHEMIRAGAKEALARVEGIKPLVMDLPIKGRLRFPDKSVADRRGTGRSARIDDYTFEATFDSALEIYEF